MPSIREIDHVVFNVENLERSLDFYHRLLGMPPERLDQYKCGEVGFPSVRINDDSLIDLFPSTMKTAVAPSNERVNHLCLVVEEPISEVEAELQRAGIPIEQGPVSGFGARGTGRSVYVRDPDGNVIELRSYSEVEERA